MARHAVALAGVISLFASVRSLPATAPIGPVGRGVSPNSPVAETNEDLMWVEEQLLELAQEQAPEAIVHSADTPAEQALEALVQSADTPAEQAPVAIVQSADTPAEQAPEAIVQSADTPAAEQYWLLTGPEQRSQRREAAGTGAPAGQLMQQQQTAAAPEAQSALAVSRSAATSGAAKDLAPVEGELHEAQAFTQEQALKANVQLAHTPAAADAHAPAGQLMQQQQTAAAPEAHAVSGATVAPSAATSGVAEDPALVEEQLREAQAFAQEQALKANVQLADTPAAAVARAPTAPLMQRQRTAAAPDAPAAPGAPAAPSAPTSGAGEMFAWLEHGLERVGHAVKAWVPTQAPAGAAQPSEIALRAGTPNSQAASVATDLQLGQVNGLQEQGAMTQEDEDQLRRLLGISARAAAERQASEQQLKASMAHIAQLVQASPHKEQ